MWAVTRAIELDSADAHGYVLRAMGVMHRGQWDRYAEALADARRAHEMNPNDTFVLRILGILEALAGEPERGIEHLHQVMRLNPRDSRSYTTYNLLATACFVAKRYADGIDWASRALRERPQMISGAHPRRAGFRRYWRDRQGESHVRDVAKSGVSGILEK